MRNTISRALTFRRMALAVSILAIGDASATVHVKDPVPIGGSGSGEYKTASVYQQAPSSGGISGFTGAWTGNTGVILANAAGLAYPAAVNYEASGGSLVISHEHVNQTTGRSSSRSIADSGLPASGTLYFSVLLMIDETALNQLKGRSEGYAQYIGVSRINHTAADASVIRFPSDKGVFVGFRRGSDGNVGLALGVNGTAFPLIPSVEVGTNYFCVVQIDLQAGEDGKEVVSAVVNPAAAEMTSGIASASTEAEILSAGQTFTYLTIGGYYATSGGKVHFDEFLLADTLYEAVPIDPSDFSVSSSAAQDVGCFSATAAGNLNLADGGTAAVHLDWGRTVEAMENTVAAGTFTESAVLGTLLENLRPDTGYVYRYRAESGGNAVTSAFTIAFTTLGAVSFADLGASNVLTTGHVHGTATHASAAATTVSLWFGETDEGLASAMTWSDVPSAAHLSHSLDDLAWGGTYRYAFKAEYTHDGETFVYWSATNTLTIVADAVWTGAGGDTDWNRAANWDIGTVPTENISARFGTAAKDRIIVSGASAIASKSLTIATKPVSFDLGEHATLTTAELTETSGSALSLLSGTVSVTGRTYLPWGATATVENGATLDANTIALQYSNSRLSVRDGGLLRSAGSASAADLANAGFTVLTGGVWLASGIVLGQGSHSLVDGGAVTNAASATFGERSGTVVQHREFEIANGGVYRQASGLLTIGVWQSVGVLVRDGGILDLDGAEIRVGGVNTGNSDNRLVVSNAAARAGTLRVCPDNRYHSNSLLVYEDEGGDASVTVSGNMRIGPTSTYEADRGHNNLLQIFGGDVSVGGALYIGNNTSGRPGNTNNVLRVKGSNARLSANGLRVVNKSVLEFTIDDACVDTPVVVAGDVTVDDTTRLVIDFTACRAGGEFTLLETVSGVFSFNVPEANILLVSGPESKGSFVRKDNAIAVRVVPTGMLILVR